MSLTLYMDVHVKRAVTDGLRDRGVDVLTAQEDGTRRLPDDQLLDRATSLGRVLFTQDKDLLAEGTRRQQAQIDFAGIVFADQRSVSIRTCIKDLELLAGVLEPEEMRGTVRYLPVR